MSQDFRRQAKDGFSQMIIDTKTIDPRELYKILIGCVLPRPIAWVSTVSKDGIYNLAPFSFFTVASSYPPVLCFSPAYSKTVEVGDHLEVVPKDTLRNVRDTKEFVVNIVSHSLAQQMNQTSGEYAPDQSEFEAAGLTPVPSHMVRPPRVGESLVNMECKLLQIIEFGKRPMAGNLILGEILCVHLADSVYKDGHIDVDVLEPIGRMAGSWYATVKDRFELPRPEVT
jgi:flavin reductase (DIM6/NTAB) family NADH-FMN oxidoreductase RutF